MNLIRNLKNSCFRRTFCTFLRHSVEKAPITNNKTFVVNKPVDSKIDLQKLPPKTKIDADTIALLEKLSLVDCANKRGIETLEAAIEFADQILQVDTSNIEPLTTVLEDIPLRIREDDITEGNCKEDILKNATITEEDYFIAPPGNIPLETRENLLYEDKSK
ncbi:hypothetical protein NQ314_012917 [Rhamnusium bicolor]|uniref:Glutamyl-tRNA(Gln) amidotransferase subunit C, mitochondrial n=1 Tax=Rhamnusium bicolor TaxID=1586634 RepID=A0AAV8X983_9CUCU|nr:hypothetical protein NQ314_012917 [Rhamnusium bicolor]